MPPSLPTLPQPSQGKKNATASHPLPEPEELDQSSLLRFFTFSHWRHRALRGRHWFRSLRKNYGFISFLIFLLVLIGLVQVWNRIFVTIDPGQAGVLWLRFQNGTVPDTVLPEGTHLILPWNKIFIYDTRFQEIQDQANFLTTDGMPLGASISARFRPKKSQLPRLHKEIGPDYIARILRPEVLYRIRSVLGQYTPQQIYSSDLQVIHQEILLEARRGLEAYPIDVEQILLVRLELPNEVVAAVKAKMVVEQEALTYQFLLEKAEGEKKRLALEAEGLKRFQDESGISVLTWRGLLATEALATSENAKVVVLGTDSETLPIILGSER